MFEGVVCVFVGPHEFLSYNDKVAALCSDFRVTANSGVHLEESRKLTDEELTILLDHANKLGENIEDRPASEEENAIIEKIKLLHPEVRYIIESFYPYTVEAKRGRKRQRKKNEKKAKERAAKPKQDKQDKQGEHPKADQPSAPEPSTAPKTSKDTKEAKEPKKWWSTLLTDMFDFIMDPDLTKEERKLKKEIAEEERDEMLKLYKQNKANFEKMDKIFKKNEGMISYISEMVDRGEVDATSMKYFTDIVVSNPEILEHMDIPSTPDEKEKITDDISGLSVDIRQFIPHVEGLEEHLNAEEPDLDAIADLLQDEIATKLKLDISDIKALTVDMDDETVHMDIPLEGMIGLIKDFGMKPHKLNA